jgi:hypothetical protein
MYRLKQCLMFLALAACVMGTIGCGDSSVLETEYVEGLVTLDGEPVAGATVTFVPVTEGQGASAVGKTDEQGVYRLTATVTGEATAKAEGGTLPGEYYVGVRKNEVDDAASVQVGDGGVEYIDYDEVGGGRLTEPSITYIVPQKYNHPRKSGITVTVQQGENNIPLELTTQ